MRSAFNVWRSAFHEIRIALGRNNCRWEPIQCVPLPILWARDSVQRANAWTPNAKRRTSNA